MYPVSEAYRQSINDLDRETKVKGTMTLTDGTVLPFTDEEIMAGTLSIDNACVSGEEFQLGSVYVGQLNASINTSINRYKAFGAIIELSFFLKLADGTFEEVPLGRYVVDEATRNDEYIDIIAYDNMVKLDLPFNKVISGTLYEMLSFIGTRTGVKLAQSEAEINELSPKNEDGSCIDYNVKGANSFETFRDLLSDVSILLGGFATIDRTGKLCIRRFGTDKVVIPSMKRKKTDFSDYIVKYDGVVAKIGDDIFKAGADEGNIFVINNELWNTDLKTIKQRTIDALWNVINNVEYTPSHIDYVGDPSLDLGDSIEYTEGSIGSQPTYSYLMKNTWKHKSNQQLVAVGKNPLVAGAKTKSEKAITNINNTIVKNELKITPFQTISDAKIGASEQTLVILEVVGVEKQVVSLIGQAILNVSIPGTFIIGYRVNDIDVVYKTMQVATYAGKWSLQAFYPITELEPGKVNKVEVFMYSPDGGEALIKKGDFIGETIGINAGVSGFDGNIEIKEKMHGLRFNGIATTGLSDSVSHII